MVHTVSEGTAARANFIAACGSVSKWTWSPCLVPKLALPIASRISALAGSDHKAGTVNQNWIVVVSKFPPDLLINTSSLCHKTVWRQVRKSAMTWSAVIPSGIWRIPRESAQPWGSRIEFSISSSSSSRSLNQETRSMLGAGIPGPQWGMGRLELSLLYARTLGALTRPWSVNGPPQLWKGSTSCKILPALPYGGIRRPMPECSESMIANIRKMRIELERLWKNDAPEAVVPKSIPIMISRWQGMAVGKERVIYNAWGNDNLWAELVNVGIAFDWHRKSRWVEPRKSWACYLRYHGLQRD